MKRARSTFSCSTLTCSGRAAGRVSHQATKFAEWRQRADDGYTVALWVVSTADGFYESCRTKAEEGGVLLIGGKDFAEMLLDAGLAGLEA